MKNQVRHVHHPLSLVLAAAVALTATAQARAAQSRQPESTPSASAAQGTDQQAALDALQNARTTMTKIVERSMSQDAREALAPLSSGFGDLYKTYTGKEPDSQTTAAQAASAAPMTDASRAELRKHYEAIDATLTRMIGPASATDTTDPPTPVGTSGRIEGIPEAAQGDLREFRQQLQRFYLAATGSPAPGASATPKPSDSDR